MVLVAPFSGAVSIMGAKLDAYPQQKVLNFFPVFSPRTHALLRIKPAASVGQTQHRKSTMQQPLDEDLFEMIQRFSQRPFDAVIVLRDLSWCGLDNIHDIQFFSSSSRIFGNEEKNVEETINSIPLFNPVSNESQDLRRLKYWNDLGISRFFHYNLVKLHLMSHQCGYQPPNLCFQRHQVSPRACFM